MFKLFFVFLVLPTVVFLNPIPDDKSIISYDKGQVGVNLGGYHASAGLGGLLTGNTADGGLHAEAGTPYGQKAAAGLGGRVNADGSATGVKYSGATAGGFNQNTRYRLREILSGVIPDKPFQQTQTVGAYNPQATSNFGGNFKTADNTYIGNPPATYLNQNRKPLISYEKGRVGVNFGGYHASAGLGGLLTGNAADGGLHAEAGTPHGQNAAAGLGGIVNANGKTIGGTYAHATSG